MSIGPNSLVVKHVLGKDESQVRFLLRAPCFESATLCMAGYMYGFFLISQFYKILLKL